MISPLFLPPLAAPRRPVPARVGVPPFAYPTAVARRGPTALLARTSLWVRSGSGYLSSPSLFRSCRVRRPIEARYWPYKVDSRRDILTSLSRHWEGEAW